MKRRLAGLLRRLADRLDPPARPPAWEPYDALAELRAAMRLPALQPPRAAPPVPDFLDRQSNVPRRRGRR